MSDAKRKIRIEYFLSFILPPLFMLAALAISKIYPFGSFSIFASDMQDQYIHSIAETMNKLKNGEDLFISYKAGFGTDFFNIAHNYTTPLFLPFLFFDTANYQEVYTVVYLLSLSLAALSACVFFSHSSAAYTRGIAGAALSTIYALSMFNVTNQINIFFMNDTILLPICFLGIEQLFNKKRIILFFAAYLAALFCGYANMPFITGIACFIYFIYFAAITDKTPRQVIKPFLMLIAAPIVAAMLCAFFLIPFASSVSSSYNGVFNRGSSLIAYGLPYVIRSFLFINDGAPVYADTPAVFIGIMPLFASLWFIFSSKARKKEKITVFCILIFYILSMHLMPLYSAMHFFRLPMGYDVRYAYGMSLILLTISARAMRISPAKEKYKAYIPFVLILLGTALALNLKSNTYYLVFAAFVILVSLFYTFIQKTEIKAKLYSCAIIAEALVCACVGTGVISRYILHPDHAGFKTYLNYSRAAAEELKSHDPSFWRAVDLYSPCKLFQLCAGYNSISTFFSTANQKSADYAASLGINVPTDGRAVTNSGNCEATDSIFGIKYIFAVDKRMMTEDSSKRAFFRSDGMRLTDSAIYKELPIDGFSAYYENTAAFPVMFCADEASAVCSEKFSDKTGSVFSNQEIFLNSLYNTDKKFYTEYPLSEPELINCHLEKNAIKLDLLSDNAPLSTEKAGTVHYSFPVEKDGSYCIGLYIDNPPASVSYQSYSVVVNGCFLNLDYLQNSITRDLGYFKKGDVIDISITTLYDGLSVKTPVIAYFDTQAFIETAKTVQKNALTDITEINGTLTAHSSFDKESFIFTTLTYDKNFEVYADGTKLSPDKILPVSDAFMGFYLPAGNHDIQLKYNNKAFKTGQYISITAALLLLVFCSLKIICLKWQTQRSV